MRRHINFFLSSIGERKGIWASFRVLLLTTYEKLEEENQLKSRINFVIYNEGLIYEVLDSLQQSSDKTEASV